MTQDQDVKRNIEDKISFLKGNDTSRKLKFKDDLFYDSIIKKRCDALSLPKDSLRKFLCRNGFNDYNFEHFRIKLKDMNDLNESYFKKKYSKLNKHIADSSFNNITYDIEYIHDSVVLDILLSEHYVDFDDEKEINAVIGIGFYKQELTVRGKTTKKNVFYKENIRFDDINKSQGIETKKRIQLNTANRFEITVDVRSHVDKYITIEDENEYILSVLKI